MINIQQSLLASWPKPELVVFDFDGVFTDNFVYVDEEGREMVRCSRADSLGVTHLKTAGFRMLIVSTETNPVVSQRAAKLGLPAHQGCGDKACFLETYLHEEKINPGRVVYIGNDINDLNAMSLVGFPVCPADADERVKAMAALVLHNSGGRGAVRELSELLLAATWAGVSNM